MPNPPGTLFVPITYTLVFPKAWGWERGDAENPCCPLLVDITASVKITAPVITAEIFAFISCSFLSSFGKLLEKSSFPSSLSKTFSP
jgi:hypothetical protein